MTCPYLDYRTRADGQERETAASRSDETGSADLAFDEARAYCTAAERFVQPMRADICNDRYGLAHDEHCEIYIEHAGEDGRDGSDGESGEGTDGV